MSLISIKEVLNHQCAVGDTITVGGWIRTRRDSKAGFSFLAVNDGSCFNNLQVVAPATLDNYDSEILKLTTSCSVMVEGTLVASHEDLEDEGQTVSFTEPSPEIGTTATDGDDGDHEAYADDDVTIVDEVRYENLELGVEHVMTGTLIDRSSAKPVEEDGKPLTVEVRFTPEEPDGSVEVVFRFDGTGLAGHTVVAFEELSLDGEVIAEHKDPNDEGQSVSLVEPPSETPGEPSTPAGKLPKTGDSLPLAPIVCLAGAALTAAGAALMARRPDGSAPEEPHEGEEEGE